MTSTTTPELIVVDDTAEAGMRQLLELNPRTIALAGGSTPRRMYERWARSEFPWPDVDIFFGDERCVPPDDVASNFRMAQESLLAKVSATVHRMPGESCDVEAYETELRSTFADGGPSFDLVLLGLGEDGHTASLFPGDSALEVTDRWVVRVERPDFERLTLTLPVLSAARVAMFLVTGAHKRTALRQLLDGGDIPAARVSAERVIVIADRAAVPLGYSARARSA
ncbi:MAG: 6-phosphogluconolactonase [Chloroflexi bacterium]|nr:6-phosphogluconolactonase [Chloroflexota bacterium]